MGDKIWVIDDGGSDDTFRMSQTTVLRPGDGEKAERPTAAVPAKNPAVAFSLSILVWGGGQIYCGRCRAGMLYLAAMVLYSALLSGLVVFRDVAARLAVNTPELVVSAMIVLVCGLATWMFNAVDAYYRARSMGEEPFFGVDRVSWPLAASLLIPGWGQFLNSQPRKGLFFLLFAAGGIFSAVILASSWFVWPLLQASRDRELFEIFLVWLLALMPFVVFAWIVSAYDAFRSCEDYLRHQLRSKMAGRRMHDRSVLSDLVPQFSAVLGLMLAISLGMQFIPKEFYLDLLEKTRLGMLNSNMSIIPELMHKVIQCLG